MVRITSVLRRAISCPLCLLSLPAIAPQRAAADVLCPGCVDTELVSSNGGYSQLALDDTYVYFGDRNGRVMRVPKTGGPITTVGTYPGNRVIVAVAVDTTNVYVGVDAPQPTGYTGNYGNLVVVPKTGGTPVSLTDQATNIVCLALDDDYIYWSSCGYFASLGSYPQANGYIARTPKAGGPVQVLASGLATAECLVLDGTNLYFGETGYVSPAWVTGVVKRVPKSGGPVVTLSSGGHVAYLAVDDTYVYGSSYHLVVPPSGEIFRVPKAGGASSFLATGLVFAGPLALSANQLFFADDGDCGGGGFVGLIDLATGAAQVLRGGLSCTVPLALDDCAVYAFSKTGLYASEVGYLNRFCRPPSVTGPTSQFSLTAANVSVEKFQWGLNLSVVRSGATDFVASVACDFVNGTARAGVDFTPVGAGKLDFTPGQSTGTVSFFILSNTVPTGNRSFSLALSNASFGTALGAMSQATITIVDNNLPGPGKPDTNFAATLGPQYLSTVNALVPQAGGRFVIGGGFTTVSNTNRPYVARLLSNGALDPSYSTGTGPSFSVQSAVGLPDQRVAIGGLFFSVNGTNRPGIAVLTTNGALDLSFNPPASGYPSANALLAQPDGKVILGGSLVYNGTNLARLNPDGSVDTSFAVGAGVDAYVSALARQPDGKILVGGAFTTINSVAGTNLARLLTNGTVDTTFSAPVAGKPYLTAVQAILPLSDGSLIVGGSFTNISGVGRTNLAKLTPSGACDPTFVPWASLNGSVLALAAQADGKLLVGGSFSTAGQTNSYIMRLNSNGSLDTSFDTGSGPDGQVNAVLPLADGSVLIGGDFSSVNGLPRSYIARLLGGGPSLQIAGVTVTNQ